MKKSNLKKLVMMTLAMGALYVPGLASAEEAAAPQEFALDEVVVTANRMENKLVDTPANVAVVTAEEIERRNYQDAIEAVKNVPGVQVIESAGGEDHFITIGGSDRVLVLVNGRRVGTSQGFSSGNAKVDGAMLPNPASIERIEVLKGGGATVYGADAVGGVINIITKKADITQFKIDVNTGSWGTQNYKGVASVKEGKTGVFIAASKAKQSYMKYKEANTKVHKKLKNSDSDNIAVNLRIDQEIGDDQLLTFFYDHVNKEGGRPNGIAENFDRQHKIDNNLALRYDWNTDSSNTGYVQVYRNNSENDWASAYPMKTSEKRIGVDVQQTFKTSETNTVVVGASYYKADVETTSSSGYDSNLNNKAVFVQDSWDFAKTWKLNTGLRYDKHSEAGAKTTASFSVNKKFNETSHAYIGWSQIFNAPDTDDLFSPENRSKYDDYEGNHIVSTTSGNRKLKAEKGDIFNIGYETKIGRKSVAGMNAFYSELDDAINWNNTGSYLEQYWAPMNIDKQKRRGMELNYKYEFDDKWSASASYAYVKVEDKSGNKDEYSRDMNQLPNQYKLGVSYTDDKWNVDLFGRGASGGAKPYYVDSKYLTLDLSVNYKVKENWKLYAKGYNLTNAAYAEKANSSYSSSIVYSNPAAGRRFVIGTEVTF